MTSKAAGILILSAKGTALFLKRGSNAPDFAAYWDFPGGGQDGNETAQETALRECFEETGFKPDGELQYHTRTKGSATAKAGVAGTGAPEVLPVPPGAPAAVPPAPWLPDVDFATFITRVPEEFEPKLDGEHIGWAWAPVDSPPEPVHPGCRVALDRLSMDELGVARAIADGRLTSPQRYGTATAGVTLFSIRITGTDVAYRTKIDEFVHRSPDNYLNDEFLARCNGLAVIYKHPKKSMLNSKEFDERVVGSVFLPYISGNEVWAIVKIYNDDIALEMEKKQLSTSPAVFFHDMSVNTKLVDDKGRKVFIEGKPSLLDHVAICEQGVWDKGGDPTGIRSESREDSAMTEAEKAAADAQAKKDAAEKEEADKKAAADAAAKKDAEEKEKAAADKAKKDADAGTQLDKTLAKMDTFMDSMGKRMDAIEESEKKRDDAAKKDAAGKKDESDDDPKKVAADKAKKDAEDKEKEEKSAADAKAKKDAEDKEKAKTDSNDAVLKRVDELAAMIPKDSSDKDFHAITDSQARADEVFAKFGQHAPRPLTGETPRLYERRVVRMLKDHSPTWKGADVAQAFADDAAFGIVRDQVYAEASKTALSPTTVKAGQLREVVKKSGGHEIREFIGEPRSWMDPMAGAVKLKATGAWKHENLGNNGN